MKNNYLDTIEGKITIAVATLSIVLLVVGTLFLYKNVMAGFDAFINTQVEEFDIIRIGPGRFPTPEARQLRHDELIANFKRSTVGSVLIASLTGIGLSILAGPFIAHQISEPLKKLRLAMHEVTGNNYKIKIEEGGSMEVRELSKSFNQLTGELERIEKIREALIHDVAHELKTPLTRIQGTLEGIQDGIYKPTKTNIKKALTSLSRLEYLIEKLQEITEIQSGQRKLQLVQVNLLSTVEDIISGYEGKNIKFNTGNIPKDFQVHADKNALSEILENLIGNAYKFTEEGEITISATENEIKVKDTGVGIPKDDLPYIFERFYRADKARTCQDSGFGLGLAIVKELVLSHEWKMNVESDKNGSVFTIILNNSDRKQQTA